LIILLCRQHIEIPILDTFGHINRVQADERWVFLILVDDATTKSWVLQNDVGKCCFENWGKTLRMLID
jgi:hypothetical protein